MTAGRPRWARSFLSAGMAAMAVLGIVGGLLWFDRSNRLDRLALSVEHDTLQLAQHADGVLNRIDLVLSDVAFTWETGGWNPADRDRLTFFARQLPEGGCITLFRSASSVVDGTCRGARRVAMDAAVFQGHAERRDITSFRADRRLGTIAVGRSAIASDGRVLGVVQVMVNASALLGAARSLGESREQAVVFPGGEAAASTVNWTGRGFAGLVEEAIPDVIGHDGLATMRVAQRDGAIVAGVRIQTQPLLAVVGATTAPLLHEWRRNAVVAGLFIGAALIGLGILFDRLRRAERAQAEAQFAAEREKALLDTIVANAPVGIWMVAKDGSVPLVNRTFVEWTGRGTDRPSITPEERNLCLASDAMAMESRVPVLVDEVLTFRDGCRHTLQIAKQAVRDPDGGVMGVVGVGLDITARKAMEEALRATASRLDAILKSAPVGIAIGSADGAADHRLDLVNPHLLEIFGRRAEDLAGATLAVLFDEPARFEAFVAAAIPAILAGGTAGQELPLRRGDGSGVWVSIAGRLVSPDDPALGIVWAIEDVTDRREAEEALRTKTAELERSNAELEAFAYVASHDLRQPLRSINAYLNLLETDLKGKFDAETQSFFDFARGGAQRMDRLIVDLLDYSRVGRRSQIMQALTVGEVVGAALENLEASIRESGARVTVDGPLPKVQGIGGELVRLFQNLIGNALKYRAADRAPVIRIACAAEAEVWHITVSDNGIGIARADFERIFGIFQRLHRRDEYEGSGIGLAVCKKVVENHGGRIWVESEPGRGSTFHVTLPLDRAR